MANAARSIVTSTGTGTTTTATFSEGTPVDTTYGLLAFVRQFNVTPPTTPSGWTLLPGSGAQGTLWTGVYARRGDNTANSITLVGPDTSRVVILLAFATISEDTFWETPTGNTASSVTTLGAGTRITAVDNSQAVAFAAVSGTAGGTGFAWSNSFVRRTGTSSSSSTSWAELAVPTSGTSTTTTATWTSTFNARTILVIVRTGVAPVPAYPQSWAGTGVVDATTLTTAVVGTGDTAFDAVAGAPVVRVLNGIPEIEVANVASAVTFRWSALDLPAWQTQFYFRFTPNSATASGITVFEARHASGLFFKLTLATNDSLGLLNSANTYIASSAALTQGAGRYRISAWGIAGTDSVHIRIYSPDGSLFWSRDQVVGTANNLNDVIFGRNGIVAYGPGYFSGLTIGDVNAELPGDIPPPATPGFPKDWNGQGVADSTTLTTTTVGTGDTALSLVSGALLVKVTGGIPEIEIANVAAARAFRWNSLDLPAWQTRFYFRFTPNSAASSGTPILEARHASGLFFKLTLATNDTIGMLNSANGFISSSPVLTKGIARYRIALWGQAGTDIVHLRMYSSDGSLFWSKDVAVGVSNNLSEMIYGRNSTVAYGPGYFSNISLGSSAMELPGYSDPSIFGYVLEADLTTLTPVGLAGMLAADLVTVIPLMATYAKYTPVEAPASGYRMPFDQPFAADNPYNTPIATTATYELASDTKTQWLSSRGTSGTVNSLAWSVNMVQASLSDPLVTVTNPSSGTVYATNIRVPAGFVPPLGSDGKIPDAASLIVQPDGYSAHEFYKFKKVNDNAWTATSDAIQDLRDSGIQSGIRAGDNSVGNGLIRKAEILTGVIPHAMVVSIPESGLKLAPTAADGQLSSNGKAVWPARTQDTQVPGALEYIGPIPMGSHFAIPPSFNVEQQGLAGAGLMAARAAQQYGVFIGDRSSSIALYAEPTALSGDVSSIKTAWRTVILPHLLRVKNNTSTNVGGGAPGATRIGPDAMPFHPSIPPLP